MGAVGIRTACHRQCSGADYRVSFEHQISTARCRPDRTLRPEMHSRIEGQAQAATALICSHRKSAGQVQPRRYILVTKSVPHRRGQQRYIRRTEWVAVESSASSMAAERQNNLR